MRRLAMHLGALCSVLGAGMIAAASCVFPFPDEHGGAGGQTLCQGPGCSGTQSCDNGAKDPDEADVDCGGICSKTCPNGGTCGDAKDCESSFCVDGFCCDTGCSGVCQACSQSKTGWSNGECSVVIRGTDPDNECEKQAESTCGLTGECGSGACEYHPFGTVCQPGSCSADNADAIRRKTCDGSGSCVAPNPATQMCSPGQCSQSDGACKCAVSSDCKSGDWCHGGVCKPRKVRGSTCALPSECATNQCVDGYCCDTTCSGACLACSAALKASGVNDGICGGARYNEPDPRGLCADNPPCGTSGLCIGPPAACMMYPATGEGAGSSPSCPNNLACDGSQCWTDCRDGGTPVHTRCRPGTTCSSTTGQCG